MAKKKFYVVWSGRKIGVFTNWDACQEQIENFKGARFKSYPDRVLAEKAFKEGPPAKNGQIERPQNEPSLLGTPEPNSLTVDAACSGNPGDMEYRGVYTATATEVFRSKVYAMGTNNIGEFLAIVHALAWMQQKKSPMTIYSDSENAIKWVRAGKARTKLEPTAKNAAIFDLISRAEAWLSKNTITVPIRKWETRDWGENPADFGRK